MTVEQVLDDLVAEQRVLDGIMARLDDADWRLPTPSARWTVRDQIAHLTYFDRMAAIAICDAVYATDHFNAHRDELFELFDDQRAADEHTLAPFAELDGRDALAAWRAGRDELERAARKLDETTRIVWYGPSMGSKSFLTARLMEVWAHGLDICDAVGSEREPTDRLRHIAQLGVITRGWSYAVRGEQPPETEVQVRLTAPSGADWQWGPEGASDSVSGPAVDFCAVVTQRRHVDDTRLVVTGAAARDWMRKAQAFAGGPTEGPSPGAQVDP